VIPNGLDLERYRPPASFSKPGTDPILIGMSARMLPPKDHATLLAAFAEVVRKDPQPGLVLELAGNGPKLAEVEAQIASLGIQDRVRLLGMLPQEDLIRRLWTWDVGVLSTFGETQSLAIMEGMACGLPLLSTRVPGVMEAVEHGVNGLLVPAGDVAAMADGIRMLVRSDSLRARLREAARNCAERNFSSKSMWGGYRCFIEHLSGGRVLAGRGTILPGVGAAGVAADSRIQL
jgi:glycosyltransferase involved in cell wall biosynthesis